jgi:hypothetical protein
MEYIKGKLTLVFKMGTVDGYLDELKIIIRTIRTDSIKTARTRRAELLDWLRDTLSADLSKTHMPYRLKRRLRKAKAYQTIRININYYYSKSRYSFNDSYDGGDFVGVLSNAKTLSISTAKTKVNYRTKQKTA